MTCAVVGFDENAKYLKIFEYLVGTLGAPVGANGSSCSSLQKMSDHGHWARILLGIRNPY